MRRDVETPAWRLAAALLFGVPMVTGCVAGGQVISMQIAAQFDAADTPVVDLSRVGPSTWDTLCVLKPYTRNAQAEQVLGFPWDADAKTSIGSRDGINVLVFVQAGRVVAHAEHPRAKGDFALPQPPCLARQAAKFVRRGNAGGWTVLVPDEAV